MRAWFSILYEDEFFIDALAADMLIYSIALVLAGLSCLWIAVLSWIRRDVPGALEFMAGNIAGCFYIFGSFFEIRAESASSALLCLGFEYMGIAIIGPLWLLVVQAACSGRKMIHDWRTVVLFAIPLVVVVSVFTNPWHGQFYSSIAINHNGPFMVPILEKGPVYVLNMVFMNGCLVMATMIVASTLLRTSRIYRSQVLIMLAGSLFPWAGMIFYQFKMSPYGLDLAPLGLTGSSIFFAWALFRYQLFDLMPVVSEQVFESMREGVLVFDLKDRLVGINPAMKEIIPSLRSDQLGCLRQDVIKAHGELDAVLEVNAGDQLSSGDRTYQIDRSDLRDPQGRVLGKIYLLTDISRQVELSQKLFAMSRTDELTGLPNRRAFHEQALREMDRLKRYGNRLAVIILDIDHFKQVNDTWGHQAGDEALIHLSKICLACLRPSDVMARFGGEEFAVLLPEASISDALAVALRMRTGLESSMVRYDHKEFMITASFGVAVLGPENRPPCGPGVDEQSLQICLDRLLRFADDAMYQAKKKGRNRVEAAKN